MRTVLVIGIGAGDPDHLTLQAVRALRRADVVFVIDKGLDGGGSQDDLLALRTELLRRHRPDGGYRLVTAPEVGRDRGTEVERDDERYRDVVVDWQDRRARLYREMLDAELADGQTGAFLVWGDPSLYDGTLRLLDRVLAGAGEQWSVESVAGISSVAALAAAHRLILNRVGRPVLITTGRRIAEGMPTDVDDVVVMLDGRTAFATLPDEQRRELHIFWGAYLGTPDELLVAGPLVEVTDEILKVRAEARENKGWIMDTYLLRRGADER
ncbi:precorrin-6A synthase (deacetylating) [Pseudonocardia alni]|uniref:precorrin-6A synthase (deacetylating) n=1 Tax=Pseudonocardia TaxID=1847 RepID=UPI001AD69C46|nr:MULTISPECIES: precorrin-6A synthase (deacetylating) [Pseudonocardia]MBO4238656.1 precorrin-6A synthase (deacetylating) [Pseudonocardia alni]MCM3847979.1 precorrin-6A synthase (deacetylating) [Pseudonocardia sp. DR1-2]